MAAILSKVIPVKIILMGWGVTQWYSTFLRGRESCNQTPTSNQSWSWEMESVHLTQAEIICEEGTSSKKMLNKIWL